MQRRVILIVCTAEFDKHAFPVDTFFKQLRITSTSVELCFTVVLRQQFIQRKLHSKESTFNPLLELKLSAIKSRSTARNRARVEKFSVEATTNLPRPTSTEQATSTTAKTITTTVSQTSTTSTSTKGYSVIDDIGQW